MNSYKFTGRLSFRLILFLTGFATFVHFVSYRPSFSKILIGLTVVVIAFYLIKGQKYRFLKLVLLLIVLFEEVPIQIGQFYRDPGSLNFFGTRTEFSLGLSPLQLVFLLTILFVFKEILVNKNNLPPITNKAVLPVLSIIVIGSLTGLPNVFGSVKFFLTDLMTWIAFLSIFYIVFSLREEGSEKTNGVLNWAKHLYIAKANAYLILLSVGRHAHVPGGRLRVFANSTFNTSILFGIFLMLILEQFYAGKDPKLCFPRGYRLKIGLQSLALLSAFILQFTLYFQTGQFLIFIISSVYLFWLVNSRLKVTFVGTASLFLVILIISSLIVPIYQYVPAYGTIVKEVSTLNIFSPDSALTRKVEWLNIWNKNINSYYGLGSLLGQGFGGYFSDTFVRFRSVGISAFPTEQLTSRKFYKPHSFFNVLLLKTGLVGLVLYSIFSSWVLLYSARLFRYYYSRRRGFAFISLVWIMTSLPNILWSLPVNFRYGMLAGIFLAGLINREKENCCILREK